jgi:hypothetical protein
VSTVTGTFSTKLGAPGIVVGAAPRDKEGSSIVKRLQTHHNYRNRGYISAEKI